MRIDILTLFPEMFSGPLDVSILKRAQEKDLLEVKLHNIRDFTHDKHRIVDDYPYGGGAGMVLKPEPIFEAIEFLLKEAEGAKIILTSPQGERLTQEVAKRLVKEERLIILCGHYEGIDERVREYWKMEEISIGDYVLSGGELACLVIIDVLTRMIPGVLGDEESILRDSFYSGLLDYPHYTRPVEYRGMRVPEVLLSGNHEEIRKWRREQSLRQTLLKRPDLLTQADLTEEDRGILRKIEMELKKKGT